jgi:enoyl-CoA hydratase
MTDHVGYALQEGGRIAVITLNRPEKRNAINGAMTAALEHRLLESERDPAVRVIVLTGGETMFCAGADLAEVAAGQGGRLRTSAGGFAGIVEARRGKPWIAAVGGAVLAGGFEIALACDIIVAADNAVFGLPEVKRGLIASGGGVYRLPRALPRHVALDLICTGRTLDARRALTLGLVSEVVAPGELAATALDMARAIAANSPRAVRESLAIARQAAATADDAIRAMTREAGDRMLGSADAREGARAFLERRAPHWPDEGQ